MLVKRWEKILIRISAALFMLTGLLFNLFLGGCAGNPGLVAYRQGDYSGALREFRDEKEPTGDFAVGVMHYKGEGVPRDHVKAADCFRRAASNGHAGAQYNLGSFICGETGLSRITGKQRAGLVLLRDRDMPRLRSIWG